MAGTLQHRVTTSVRSNAGTVSADSYTLTGDSEFNHEETARPIGTDVNMDGVIDVSQIVSIVASSTTALTIKTNSAGSPANTITLAANKPLMWNTQIQSTLGTACPLTTDVTAFYVTNAALADFKLYILTSGS